MIMQRPRIYFWLAIGFINFIPSVYAQEDLELIILNPTIISLHLDAPLVNSSVVIQQGKIDAIVDTTTAMQLSAKETIDASGLVLLPGFWNSHVHFTEPHWNIGDADVKDLQQPMDETFNRFGFVSVVDTGSNPLNTLQIKMAIEVGSIKGPRIWLASGGFVPKDGTPKYLKESLPEVTTPDEARQLVRNRLGLDVDAIKIFTGTYQGDEDDIYMPLSIVKAVTEEAHAHNWQVFSHPQGTTGVINAIAGGVDVLAHTTPWTGPWGDELIQRLVEDDIAVIPTLALTRYEMAKAQAPDSQIKQIESFGAQQVSGFHKAGGRLLFGTDVGYMLNYDPTREYLLMAEAGLSFEEIIRTLTTNPARQFGIENVSGTIEVGKEADFVLLMEDPAIDIRNLAKVKMTIRNGEVVYTAP